MVQSPIELNPGGFFGIWKQCASTRRPDSLIVSWTILFIRYLVFLQ